MSRYCPECERLARELAAARRVNAALAERVAAQSEILSRRAERPVATVATAWGDLPLGGHPLPPGEQDMDQPMGSPERPH